MSITIKQAFQKLAMVTGAAVKNPWFVGRNLNQAFAEIADNVVDASGDKVTVTPITDSGTKIAEIKVNNTTSNLYAPTAEVVYSTTERKIGKWIDGTTDVYQKVIEYTPESSITTGDHVIADVTGLKILKYNAVAFNSTSGKSFNIPVSFGSTTTAIGTSGNNLILTLTNETWGTDSSFIVIIEYIKTT